MPKEALLSAVHEYYQQDENAATLLIKEMGETEHGGDGVGCGEGRPVCLAATRALKKVVGVELREGLVAAARANASKMRFKKTPIDIIQCDAADFSGFSVDGNVGRERGLEELFRAQADRTGNKNRDDD